MRYAMGIYRAPANGVAVQQRWRKDARALEREEEVCTPCLMTHSGLWCCTVNGRPWQTFKSSNDIGQTSDETTFWFGTQAHCFWLEYAAF